uniref:Uncharacterized protein n=1 Tax=Oryza glumipatula TaxID=40148 RepID=A0A0D9ZX15_9ORYZ
MLLKELDDSFEEFQDQVRREVEEKGYYEVGMDYFVQRAEYEAWLDKKWAERDFFRLEFEDEDEDMYGHG